MKEIDISIDNCKISFTTYESAIEWLQKEQVLMNSDKFLKLVKSNVFLQNYLKENNYTLPIGRVSTSSYKGMTETSDYSFTEEYYKIADNLKRNESDIINLLFYDNADLEGSNHECDNYYSVKVSEDLLSYKINITSEEK